MAKYLVKKIRKEWSGDGMSRHVHIVGVVTPDGVFHPNIEVSNSINAGHEWLASVPGQPEAKIHKVNYCAATGCMYKPYLSTNPDYTAKNNLENLPEG